MEHTIYYISCEEAVIYASSEYDAVFARRDGIIDLGMCREPHPIRSKVVVF